MSKFFYPNDPRRYRRVARPAAVEPQPTPTLEDYEQLVAAYRELKNQHEQQSKVLEEKQTELGIKDEALQRQSADMKQLESNLLWTKAALEAAQSELQKLQEENWQERYLQQQAEVDNLRKRWEQRYTAQVNEARNRILVDMLPLADHLDLALQHAGDGLNAQSFTKNIEATRRAFLETLKRYGVERLEAQGQPFDPNLHEAVGQIVDAQTPADHVAQVVQQGYMDGERVLRPARVVVSKSGE